MDPKAFLARDEDLHLVVHDLTVAEGGSISAEHGIGLAKRDEIQRYKSPVEVAMMRAIKAALDPKGIMNPGKGVV
jgi:FAD/FMN-containing dehydrogenase